MENYKKCPLKKRPIVYEESGDNLQPENLSTKPEDLSLRNALIVQPRVNSSTKNFPLNLSSTSVYDQLTYMNPVNWCVTPVKVRHSREGSVSPGSDCSNTSSEFNRETSISPPASSECKNIHLRGLTYPQAVRVENNLRKERYVPYYNYRKEHTPQPVLDLTNQWPDTIYPSLQPQDLSIKSYIPEPALYHPFSKTNREDKTKSVSRYKCNDCGKSYSTFAGLSKHQQFHCPAAECNQVKKVFSCKSCDKVYTSLGALKMHIRTHTLPCKCTICGKAFSRPWLLQGHIRTHTGEKPFSCQYCHRAFADRSNLRAHLQTHSEVKKYSCTNVSCNKTFSRMSLLSKHIQGGCSTSTAEVTARCI